MWAFRKIIYIIRLLFTSLVHYFNGVNNFTKSFEEFCCPCYILFLLFYTIIVFFQIIYNKFFNDESEWVEETILVLPFRMFINEFFCVTADIQLRKFKFKKAS